MKLAIMQPYLFPYIGYFQLIHAVDKFVIYDDVNYINKGWINRNNILINGNANLFTVPLKEASQNKLINEISLSAEQNWQPKLLKTLEMAYKKAPFFTKIFSLLETLLETKMDKISSFNFQALRSVSAYLDIQTEFVESSVVYANSHLKGPERILDICQQEKAAHYVNPVGGMELYNKEIFASNGIRLNFIKSDAVLYPQFKNEFVPWLSIIDVCMFNDTGTVKKLLGQYQLI